MIDFVHQTVMEDRQLTVKDIAEVCEISSEQMHEILHQDLDVRKLSARGMPGLFDDRPKVHMDEHVARVS